MVKLFNRHLSHIHVWVIIHKDPLVSAFQNQLCIILYDPLRISPHTISTLVWSNQEELPHTQGQGPRLRGATPRPRSGAAAERSNHTSKEQLLCRQRRAERTYSTFKVRRCSPVKIPFIQGKEQWLRLAGAAVKRYPTSKVRETQVRR